MNCDDWSRTLVFSLYLISTLQPQNKHVLTAKWFLCSTAVPTTLLFLLSPFFIHYQNLCLSLSLCHTHTHLFYITNPTTTWPTLHFLSSPLFKTTSHQKTNKTKNSDITHKTHFLSYSNLNTPTPYFPLTLISKVQTSTYLTNVTYVHIHFMITAHCPIGELKEKNARLAWVSCCRYSIPMLKTPGVKTSCASRNAFHRVRGLHAFCPASCYPSTWVYSHTPLLEDSPPLMEGAGCFASSLSRLKRALT